MPTMGNAINANLRWYQTQRTAIFPEPDLFVYAQEGDWGSLILESHNHPTDVFYQDRFRNTALHLVCRRQPPLDVIVALVRVYPTAVAVQTIDGMTPLHLACYCGANADAIKILLEACATSVSILDNKNRSPLHCACAGYRTLDKHEVIKLLLQYDPGLAVLEDSKKRTPLSLMLDDYVEEIEEATYDQFPNTIHDYYDDLTESSKEEDDYSDIITPQLQQCINCTTYLLKAAHYGSVASDRFSKEPFQIVHSAVGVATCPPHLVRLAIKLKPEQVEEPDINGNLPLHIAAMTKYPDINYSDENLGVVDSILSLYPEAARIPNDSGKLPLCLAIESGKTWDNGIRSIIEAHPGGLATIQIEVRLFHRILEQISKDFPQRVFFEVIKSNPEILSERTYLVEERDG